MQQLTEYFKEMSMQRIVAILVLVLGLIVAMILYIFRSANVDFAVLYSDLDQKDSASITQELDKRGTRYRLLSDGAVITVPKNEVETSRIAIAQAGLPSGSNTVGYEIFDQEDSIGVTNFAQNVKFVRALEGELGRTITALDKIASARVHLVIPQREIFSKEKIDTKASVVVKLKSGSKLTQNEIDGIAHLMTSSVSSLVLDNLSIIDSTGQSLLKKESEDDISFNKSKEDEIKSKYERDIQAKVEDLLSNIVGPGKVRARVALNMNFDKEVLNEEIYDPDSAVVRSSNFIDERQQTPVSGGNNGDVSVANNIPTGNSNNSLDPNKFSISEKSDQVTNYEISKTVRNFVRNTGVIDRLTVAVVIDGNRNYNADSGNYEYVPYSVEELNNMTELVKNAVGFDSTRNDKVEVLNMRFSDNIDEYYELADNNQDWFKDKLPSMLQTLVVAVLGILTLLTVIRPVALKVFDVNRDDNKLFKKKDDKSKEDLLDNINIEAKKEQEQITEKAAELEKSSSNINDMVTRRTDEVFSVINKWIEEDPGK